MFGFVHSLLGLGRSTARCFEAAIAVRPVAVRRKFLQQRLYARHRVDPGLADEIRLEPRVRRVGTGSKPLARETIALEHDEGRADRCERKDHYLPHEMREPRWVAAARAAKAFGSTSNALGSNWVDGSCGGFEKPRALYKDAGLGGAGA